MKTELSTSQRIYCKMAKSINYKTSGVDIAKANSFVSSIRADIAKTKNSNVLNSQRSFGGLYALTKGKYKDPVLVSSTDGVGTKLLIAQKFKKHGTIGIDLVAMNVNDILCVGAQPLFFLDYIACGKLNPSVLKSVVKGIVEGCRQSGMSLIGGETAEMPDMYRPDEYDLAGFAVGIVEKKRILDGRAIKAGDILIGFPSTGFHSNGYSLVRKVFNSADQKKYLKEILAPTRIYAEEVLLLKDKFELKGVAHITGGAYFEKLTKILPKGKCFRIKKNSWPVLDIFKTLQNKGKITDKEMYRTFNMGIGLGVVVASKDLKRVEKFLQAKKMSHYVIGDVVNSTSQRIIL